MNGQLRRTLQLCVGLFACTTTQSALSAPAFEDCRIASDAELDDMRGGFEVNLNGAQLMLSFSLERVTYINGELVASMRISVPDLSNLQAGGISPTTIRVETLPIDPTATDATRTLQPRLAAQHINGLGPAVTVIQNGAGNTFTLPLSLNSLTTVIQNTVDNQIIRNMTTLNATIVNQALSRAMEITSSINQAVANSVR